MSRLLFFSFACIIYAVSEAQPGLKKTTAAEKLIAVTNYDYQVSIKLLDAFRASEKKSNDVVTHLQTAYSVPRYWARTIITHYLKSKD